MKYFLSLVITFFVLHVGAQSDLLYQEIDRMIMFDTEIKFENTPGFMIGIVDEDSTYVLSFGNVADQANVKLNGDDIFELGSVSKSFTSSLIKILMNKGLLTSKDLVNSFLDENYRNPRLNNLTVGDLINHTSGLPKRPIGFGMKEVDVQNPYFNYTREDLLNFYSYFVPSASTEFEYSHTNYALLEVIIEKVTGLSFEDNMIENIFKPLDLSHTMVDFYEKKKNVLTPGIDRTGELVQPWVFRSFAASEAIKSSVDDMVVYMKELLSITAKVPALALSDPTNANIQSFNDKIKVHEGWQLLKINKKHSIHINTGSTSGYSSFLALDSGTNTGVVILSNSAFGTGDLGLLVLRMINNNWKRKVKITNG